MKLELKQTLKDIFSQKDYCGYLVFFALLSSFAGIISNANNLPYKWEVYTIASVILYIPLGYVINFVHSKINNTNEENTFAQACNTGMKLFIALITNTIIAGFIISIILVATALLTKFPVENFNNLKLFISNPIMFCVTAFLFVICMLLFTFMNVKFADKFSIKETFNWIEVFKPFCKKFKETLLVLVVCGLILLALIASVFLLNLVLNVILIFLVQHLVAKGFAIASILLLILSVTITVLVASIHYVLLSLTYTLLAKIYKSNNTKIEAKSEDLSELQADTTDSNQD